MVGHRSGRLFLLRSLLKLNEVYRLVMTNDHGVLIVMCVLVTLINVPLDMLMVVMRLDFAMIVAIMVVVALVVDWLPVVV